MRKVLLYGHLGQRFGRTHHYDVRTPAEAVRALCATVSGFREHLAGHSQPGYRVRVGRQTLVPDALHHPAAEVIRIVPVTAGAGRSAGIILGIALIAFSGPIGVAFGATAGTAATATTAAVAGSAGFMGITTATFGMMGLSMVLGGVAQLLAPQPKMAGPADRPNNLPSHAFDGAVNVAAQGNPVPVCYGRMIVGSVVISAALVAEEYTNQSGVSGKEGVMTRAFEIPFIGKMFNR